MFIHTCKLAHIPYHLSYRKLTVDRVTRHALERATGLPATTGELGKTKTEAHHSSRLAPHLKNTSEETPKRRVERSSGGLAREYRQKNCWGMLASLDIYGCDRAHISQPKLIRELIIKLCERISMKRYGEPLIKRFGEGELEGYSALQFIHTSSITMHFDELQSRAFIEIFSCKFFDPKKAETFCRQFLKAQKSKLKHFFRY